MEAHAISPAAAMTLESSTPGGGDDGVVGPVEGPSTIGGMTDDRPINAPVTIKRSAATATPTYRSDFDPAGPEIER